MNTPLTPRDLDDLLAVAAHELRHPLYLMRLALARYLPRPEDPAREALERYVSRMARIVDDLVECNLAQQGGVELNLECVNLNDLLAELVGTYRLQTDATAISLEIPAAPIWVMGDAHRLTQVFANLLENALKFTPHGGAVRIQLTGRRDVAEIRVSDTGAGIQADALPHVFDRFISGSKSLGIGLTIAKYVIEAHLGEIAVTSDGEGHGTEVLVTVPRLDEPRQAEPSFVLGERHPNTRRGAGSGN